jgi:predicted nucleic acid-binding protein
VATRRPGRPSRFDVRESSARYAVEPTAPRRVLVDTNVLIDVLANDPTWYEWSARELGRVIDEAQPVMNPIVYAEVAANYDSIEALDSTLNSFNLMREHLPWQAAFLAARAQVLYRARGGKRATTLPDFFIGAHAALAGYTLLTRDAQRYREYFPKLAVIAP